MNNKNIRNIAIIAHVDHGKNNISRRTIKTKPRIQRKRTSTRKSNGLKRPRKRKRNNNSI